MHLASHIVKARRGGAGTIAPRVNVAWHVAFGGLWVGLIALKRAPGDPFDIASASFAALLLHMAMCAAGGGPLWRSPAFAPSLLLATHIGFVDLFASGERWRLYSLALVVHALAVTRSRQSVRLSLVAAAAIVEVFFKTCSLPVATLLLPLAPSLPRRAWSLLALSLCVQRLTWAESGPAFVSLASVATGVVFSLCVAVSLRVHHHRPTRRFCWRASVATEPVRSWCLASLAAAIELVLRGGQATEVAAFAVYLSLCLGACCADAMRAATRRKPLPLRI